MKQAANEAFENDMHHHHQQQQSRVFCTVGNIPYSTRIEAKKNLPGCLFCEYKPFRGKCSGVTFWKKNLANYQTMPQTYLRNLILITIWKDQLYYCATKIQYFCYVEFLVYYTLEK